MSAERIRLSREELYGRVWTTPIHRLSKEFGLSDVGLAKLCRRHRIPIPGRGYWRRIETGQELTRPALPPFEKPGWGYVEIAHREWLADLMEQEPTAAKEQESKADHEIKVADGGPIRHPFAIRAKRLLANTSNTWKDERGILHPSGRVFCPIKVSRAVLPCAIRILDALLLALEGRGHALTWPDKDESKFSIAISDRLLEPILPEVVKQRPHAPTKDELIKQRKYSWQTPKQWDFDATGRLKLTLDGGYWITLRRSWTDGKRQRLEACLGEVLRTVRLFEHVFKKQAEEAARRAQEEQERRKREEEERQRQAEYARKFGVLRKLTNAWHESKLMRGFIEALKKASEENNLTSEEQQDVHALIDWAADYIKSLDPFHHLVKSVHQFKGVPNQSS